MSELLLIELPKNIRAMIISQSDDIKQMPANAHYQMADDRLKELCKTIYFNHPINKLLKKEVAG